MADDAPHLLEDWLAAARGGSDEALGQALQACRLYLLMIAERELEPAVRAKGGASDLVQQTFMEAQGDFARFHGTDSTELRAWLRRLLLNNVANFRRHYRGTAKRRADRETPLDAGDSTRGGNGAWLADDTPSPSRQLMQEEKDQDLRRALDRLPPDYRQVLLLRYEEELPFEEVAQRMGRTANAARKLWSRAVEQLQRELEAPP